MDMMGHCENRKYFCFNKANSVGCTLIKMSLSLGWVPLQRSLSAALD